MSQHDFAKMLSSIFRNNVGFVKYTRSVTQRPECFLVKSIFRDEMEESLKRIVERFNNVHDVMKKPSYFYSALLKYLLSVTKIVLDEVVQIRKEKALDIDRYQNYAKDVALEAYNISKSVILDYDRTLQIEDLDSNKHDIQDLKSFRRFVRKVNKNLERILVSLDLDDHSNCLLASTKEAYQNYIDQVYMPRGEYFIKYITDKVLPFLLSLSIIGLIIYFIVK